jgi:nitroreductase
MTFNDLSSPLALLRSRRSAKPRFMVPPGPDAAQLDEMLAIATRTPDHGKLFPWRFVIVGSDQRDALAELLVTAYRRQKPEAGRLEIEATEQFARQAPVLVVALSAPSPASHIPMWEQELSAGAACMNLLHAANAMGFSAAWLTGWAAYDDMVRDAFGGPDERLAGFIFIGTPGRPLEERPRPELDKVVRRWGS